MDLKKSTSFLLLTIPLILLLLSATCSSSFAQQRKAGIHFFTGTMEEALAKAKKEKKHLFFDAYASWCGPCKYMDSAIYTRADIGTFFNQYYISVRMDMEKGEGPSLAKKFKSVDGYPSLLFFGSDGFLIKTLLGSRSSTSFLKEARLALVN
jgi:thioredoxin 1